MLHSFHKKNNFFEFAMILIVSFSILFYGINAWRFASCDFKPSYKGEILYGMGLVLPTFYITWAMDLDK